MKMICTPGHFFGLPDSGRRTMINRTTRKNRGFTLVELMVALVLSSIAAWGIYKSYVSFDTSFTLQEQIGSMQQNLRLTMGQLVKEIRMAGYDPTKKAGAGIDTAKGDEIKFSMDLNQDNNTSDTAGGGIDTGERIKYKLVAEELKRTDLADPALPTTKILAENISAITFVYLDLYGNVLTDTILNGFDGVVDTDSGGSPVPLGNAVIRSVQITITAKTGVQDFTYTDPTYLDHYRRRSLTARVRCRNLGLGEAT